MTRDTLEARIADIGSLLCVGLDPVVDRLPVGIERNAAGVLQFLKTVVDATQEHCVAYKPNLAFFECLGVEGIRVFQQIVEYIPPTHFIIADAKRGDIGNTARRYAEAFFTHYGCDAITVAPYMGQDSVEPFLVDGHWAIVLGLTSNPGSADFEQLQLTGGDELWERVVARCVEWGSPDQLMLVTGATKASAFGRIRALAPEHFFLVPGVGTQGGDLEGVLEHGLIRGGGLLINSSRGILYAGAGADFGVAAAREAGRLRRVMGRVL